MRSELKDVMARAKESSFYRQHLSGISDWERVPLTTKADLQRNYPFGLLAVKKQRLASYHESSGTEGRSVASFYTEKDWEDIISRFLRSSVELTEEDTFFIKTPYSMVMTAHQAQRAAASRGAMVIPADNRSLNMPYSRVVELLSQLGVTVSWSLPTEVLLWRIAAEANGISPDSRFESLRAFWVAGETLGPHKRQAISKLWGGTPVIQDYGSTETGSLAGECPMGSLHLWSDRVFFEVYDPSTGNFATSGVGQLVVTPLFREAMPLVRYLIGDWVEISLAGCACGSRLPTVRVYGRGTQTIEVGRQAVTAYDIEEAVFEAGANLKVTLWRAVWSEEALEIAIYGLGAGDRSLLKDFSRAISERLRVPVSAEFSDLKNFLEPGVLTAKSGFNKPKFVFKRGESFARGIQYA